LLVFAYPVKLYLKTKVFSLLIMTGTISWKNWL